MRTFDRANWLRPGCSDERYFYRDIVLRVVRRHIVRAVPRTELVEDLLHLRRFRYCYRACTEVRAAFGQANRGTLPQVLEPIAIQTVDGHQVERVALAHEPHRDGDLPARRTADNGEFDLTVRVKQLFEVLICHFVSPRSGRASLRCVLDDAPDAFGGAGHVDVSDAEVTERVDDGVVDGGSGSDGAGFADAFGAEWVSGAVGLGVRDFEAGEFGGGWDGVVHQVCGTRVAVVVVLHPLVKCLGCALCDAAVLLAGDEERVEDAAAVVDGDVAEHGDVPVFGGDLDHRDVRSERVGGVGAV